MKFNQQIVFIFILLALSMGKSFSHALHVKEVTKTEKELAAEGDSNFSLQKEILPNAGEVETSARIGGRKMSVETTAKASKEQGGNSKKISGQRRNRKKISMASSSSAVIPSVGNRKGDEEENWKDNFMAFSADYRSPKPHPPKNN